MYSFIVSAFMKNIKNPDSWFATLSKLGIKHFEPCEICGKNIADFSDDEIFLLLTVMKKYKMRASLVCPDIGKCSVLEDFAPYLERFKRLVDISKALGTEYIKVSGFFVPEGVAPENHRGAIIWRLVQMVTYAKSQNVVVLLENNNDTYAGAFEHFLDLLDSLSCSNFKGFLNTYELDADDEDIKKLCTFISYTHIKDVNSKISKDCISALKDNEYIGFLGFEADEKACSEEDLNAFLTELKDNL